MIKGTFLGRKMAQTPRALALWERVLRSTDFARVIEIGTYYGGLSLYFTYFCLEKKAEFITYDIVNFKVPVQVIPHRRLSDVFEVASEIIEEIQKPGITVLFCDGGNKAKEFQTFAPHIKEGDVIAVHDWKTEIFPEDVKETCDAFNISPILESDSDKEGMLRFFKHD